jgi:chromosome segregation ATPase
MPLDPEIQKAIADTVKEQLTSVFGEAVKPLSEQLEKQQHDNKKLSEAFDTLTNSIPTLFEERFQDIKPSLEFISEVRKEYLEEEQDKPKAESTSVDKMATDSNKLREAINEIKKDYEGKLTGLQTQLDERDKETKTLREADRQTKMRTEVLNIMRGLGTVRPSTEEDLLTLLEKRGLLIEENDRYFVKGMDKFNEPTKLDVKDILPKMLESDFAHFAIPRGGTGTDGTPGIRTTPSAYNFDGMSAQDIYNTYGADEAAQKAIVTELESQYGKSS